MAGLPLLACVGCCRLGHHIAVCTPGIRHLGHLELLQIPREGGLEAYATLAASFREAIETADAIGDEASRELLADRLETLEDDAHTIERYVEDDTLVEGGR